jgi:tetratricopeptide (TPR) repeat protein
MTEASKRSRSAWARRALLAAALSMPALARADEPPQTEAVSSVLAAERLAAQAFQAYGRKQYGEAVALYEQAYASAPSADALYNIARVYDVGLHDRARAMAAYERCLSEPGATLERLERASERLLELRRSESAELEPARQGTPANSTLPDQPAPGEPERGSTLRAAAWISGAAGVLGLGVGFGFGMTVLSEARHANASCNGNRCTSPRAVAAAQSASNHATIATTGVAVGTALVLTSAALLFWDAHDSAREAPARVRVTPVADASELGLAVGGNW